LDDHQRQAPIPRELVCFPKRVSITSILAIVLADWSIRSFVSPSKSDSETEIASEHGLVLTAGVESPDGARNAVHW
jgi:hypothetical protein